MQRSFTFVVGLARTKACCASQHKGPLTRRPLWAQLWSERPGGSPHRQFAPGCLSISGFTECAQEAVEDRLHDVLEKSALTGLDVNVGRHPGCRNEFRDAPEYIVWVETHANDIVTTRVGLGACFSLDLQLLRQGVCGDIDDARSNHRGDALIQCRQPDQRLLPYADMRNILRVYMC